ncbi:MAG: excinuclease ABC subunit UvrC [Clostridiales bacterium]|jgi:excinuclease ABC subunit C|nr:excinuclease ABC subunit UvrC [Eubacteriales bacterium]MDH7566911.1 excinuclease ABC subunit UvrC [Clostridiales bacterium]
MFDIQEELKKLPDKPGVYLMKDQNGEIIYVGKAVVLKNRVRQYFQASANHSPKVAAMVERIREFEYIVTHSELEALILECNLIKKYKPKYNILLKDDKSYPYIKVTMNEEYPRILMTRRIEKDGAKYYGPYSNATAVKETIELLRKLFPLKSCKKVLPRDIGKERPCLNFYIYQCLGPCQGGVNRDEYRRLMKDICLFLEGKQEEIIKKLEQQMRTASENMEFEKAAGLRDKINSLRHIAEKQKVLSTAMEDQDVIACAKGPTDSCIQVFFIRGGKLIGREHFIFEGEGEGDGRELMSSFIKQFYSAAALIPPEIILQEDIDELDVIERWLTEKRASRVYIKVPRRGEKRQLIEMVSQNALMALQQFRDQIEREGILAGEGLQGIASVLGLEAPPERIEAYDISNTGTSEMVASMVVFERGIPAKKEYRKFKMKSVNKQDDYASMQEVIYRRFNRAQKEKREPSGEAKFSKLPDLILVDGGLGHVNAASSVLKEMGVDIPVFGMVKDDRHHTRGLVSQREEVDITKNLPVLRFVTAVQNEAHRFAIQYNRKLREGRYSRSVLDDIEGIGPVRKKALIKHFGSIHRIKEAEMEDLMKVEGITKQIAGKIYDYFRE